jgi:hypothetical protein
MGVDGERYAPAALRPAKETRYPLCWRLTGSQGQSGRVRKISAVRGFVSRTVQPRSLWAGRTRYIYRGLWFFFSKGALFPTIVSVVQWFEVYGFFALWYCIFHVVCSTTNKTLQLKVGEGKGKGKAVPIQAWTGPEGSRRLRLPDFYTIGTWRW